MQITKDMCIGASEAHVVNLDATFKAHKDAIKAFLALKDKLKTRGFSLDIASAFRDFARQELIFDSKYNGIRPVFNKDNEKLDLSSMSSLKRVESICIFSAIPGFSRHHFGSEFDIYSKDLLPQGQSLQLSAFEYLENGYFHSLYCSLKDLINDFDFYMPYGQDGSLKMGFEPWHISYKPVASKFIEAFDIDYALDYIMSKNHPWSQACCDYAKENFKTMLAI